MSAATYITIGTLVFVAICLMRLSAVANKQLSAGAVPSTLPKTPVTPLSPVTATAVPAASISAGAIKQQAKPSASVRSADSADSFNDGPTERFRESRLEHKTLRRVKPQVVRAATGEAPVLMGVPVSNLKPRWALTPGTIATLNREIVK